MALMGYADKLTISDGHRFHVDVQTYRGPVIAPLMAEAYGIIDNFHCLLHLLSTGIFGMHSRRLSKFDLCPNAQKPHTPREALQSLQQLLRITTSHILLGTSAGTDKTLNIILINAGEYPISQGPAQRVKLNENGRDVGQVMLPWKMIIKVEVYERSDTTERGRRNIGDHIYL
ncbi:hypothetical protein BYT27DRAFT_7250362 [Phlegmacium glaucopus]|nr:hypothetical protein BYT27DRAFT_7250362 [Phlegmacium glaucopus]